MNVLRSSGRSLRMAASLMVLSGLLLSACNNGNGNVNANDKEEAKTVPVYYTEDSTERVIPDFRFQSNLNTPISNKDLAGSIYIADFFFTRCPGICKDMSANMRKIQEQFKENERVKIVSFTVDPEYDNVAALQNYAKLYNAVPGKWYFLTGSKDSLYHLAKYGFSLSALVNIQNPEEFDHAKHFVLIDKQGRIRGYYDGTDSLDVERIIKDIEILLKEDDK